MIFLASPYSHSAAPVEKQRFIQTREFVAQQLLAGKTIFSPIVYAHQFKIEFGFAGDADFWKHFNFAMLQRAQFLWVLRLDGWRNSVGVAAEIATARELCIPTLYKDLI